MSSNNSKATTYTGGRDQHGRCHGRGTLTIDSQVFQGRFQHGLKEGRGSWYFADGSTLASNHFSQDEINGVGVYHSPEEDLLLVGTYTQGELQGEVEEYTADGQTLVYCGEYRDNQRHGFGVLYSLDGGKWSGTWRCGQFHGKHNTYHYPAITPQPYTYRGEWRDGVMHSALLYAGEERVGSERGYCADESVLGDPIIAEHPLLPDLYEQACCFVHESPVGIAGDHAGQGLFARIDLPYNAVVSFYNGVKQLEHTTEHRVWSFNDNCIALDEETGIDIDVPVHYSQLSQYCASLGHKANHSFDPKQQNCKYDHCLHPRFGHIKCIRVIAREGVAAGTELLVDYGYSKHARGGPPWWQRGIKAFKQQLEEGRRQESAEHETSMHSDSMIACEPACRPAKGVVSTRTNIDKSTDDSNNKQRNRAKRKYKPR